MTIKEFAKGKGVSTQAVYQKIKAVGLDITQLRAENSTELTENGIDTLNQLFVKQKEKTDNKLKLIDKIKEQEREIAALKIRLEEVTADRDRWAAAAEAAQQTAQEAQRTAQQAQALNMATLKALPAPGERRSLWERLTRRKENKTE